MFTEIIALTAAIATERLATSSVRRIHLAKAFQSNIENNTWMANLAKKAVPERTGKINETTETSIVLDNISAVIESGRNGKWVKAVSAAGFAVAGAERAIHGDQATANGCFIMAITAAVGAILDHRTQTEAQFQLEGALMVKDDDIPDFNDGSDPEA